MAQIKHFKANAPDLMKIKFGKNVRSIGQIYPRIGYSLFKQIPRSGYDLKMAQEY
jgi:hypothetical protein